MDALLPLLRWGSHGETVRNLQASLDLWPDSHLAALNVDGMFGPMTHSKVLEFQRSRGLAADGVVGQHTWAALRSYLEQVMSSVQTDFESVRRDREVGDRTVKAAERALRRWGWPTSIVHEDPGSPYIAAARPADPSDRDDPRPRQGGQALAEMFTQVGVPAGNCLKISREAERRWQHASYANVIWLNRNDILDWCGIFCCYVYRTAHVEIAGALPTWSGGRDFSDPNKFRHTEDLYQVLPGSVSLNAKNHYRIVAKNELGKSMEFIEGNVPAPNQHDYYRYGMNSVMRRSKYSYGLLQQPQHRQTFYFPVSP